MNIEVSKCLNIYTGLMYETDEPLIKLILNKYIINQKKI